VDQDDLKLGYGIDDIRVGTYISRRTIEKLVYDCKIFCPVIQGE
jgi:hypothetical protein